MKIFCCSDIHGCLFEFEDALSVICEYLNEDEDSMLILLGDYVQGGPNSLGVIDKIMQLQFAYGNNRVVALMGNHDSWVLEGSQNLELEEESTVDDTSLNVDKYYDWISSLPYYHTEGNTIFVHAGIEEDAGEMWEWETGEDMYLMKYPATIGKIKDLDMKVVAGHVATSIISGDRRFHDIFYDGESHYYIDGSVLESGVLPILMVDTNTNQYYKVTCIGLTLIIPYEEM